MAGGAPPWGHPLEPRLIDGDGWQRARPRSRPGQGERGPERKPRQTQVRARSRPSSQGGFNPEAQEGTSVSTTKGRKDDSPLGTGHGRRSQFQLGAVSGWGVLGV